MSDLHHHKFINVEKILQEKAPKFYRLIPRFLINKVRKILHEKEINAVMHIIKDKRGLAYNDAILEMLGAKIEYVGIENVPKEGGVIIASNHPLGGADGMALIKAVSVVRKDIHFIVNEILTKLENFDDLFVGVNKLGATAKQDLLKVEKILSSDCVALFFPAGLVSRKQKINGRWQIKDLNWNKTFVQKAIQYKKPIIPVFIEGRNSEFFYNFSLWRKRMRIKGNIEMLFLPDEMFKQKDQTIKIYFGKPINTNVFEEHKMSFVEWAAMIKEFVYSGYIQKNQNFEDFLK